MGEGNELPKSIEDRIDLVDSWILSPENRSKKVWTVISESKAFQKKELTNWDIICFATAYLKQNVVVFPWLLEVVKPLGRLIFNAHYFATEATGLLIDLDLDKDFNKHGLQQQSESIPEGKRSPNGTPRFE